MNVTLKTCAIAGTMSLLLAPGIARAAQLNAPVQVLGRPAWTFNVPVRVDHIPAAYAAKMGVQCVVTTTQSEPIGRGGLRVPLAFGAYTGTLTIPVYPLAGKDPSLGRTWMCWLGYGDPNGFLPGVDPNGEDPQAAPKHGTAYTLFVAGQL